MIHPLSDCQAKVPESTNIWQFCVVLPGAKIGENCNICSHCIENEAVIGNNVTIKNGVQTARIIEGIEAVLTGKPLNDGMSRDKSLNEPLALNDGCRYDGVIVYGDTNSTLAAAVAASKIHVPVFGADWAFEDFRAV